ncbi:MAG: hypothetical protein KKH20_10300, partial [Proteobacteria bacterium]|nr:hypothetical protein [Pseudomonadota bacterium]
MKRPSGFSPILKKRARTCLLLRLKEGAKMVDMLPSFLNNRNLKLAIFGGKGGTGKTTSASSAALCLAWLYPSKKILLISSDPAHS